MAPFFIIGAQRSGTTLLRLMLNANPQVAIPEEGTFWMPLLRRYRKSIDRRISGLELKRCLSYIDNNAQFKLWGIDPSEVFDEITRMGGCNLRDIMARLYSAYAARFNKEAWGDKTPSFFRMVPILARLFPEARFIHIVRDGRDLFLSWRKIEPSKKNISVVALEWMHKTESARDALNKTAPGRSIEIRYEDLVSEPGKTLQFVCAHCDMEYSDKMLSYWQSSNKFIGSHHSHLIFRPVSTSSTGRWRSMLSAKETRLFECVAGTCLIRTNYQLSSVEPPRFLERLHAIIQLIYGIPLRAIQIGWTAVRLSLASRFGWATDASGKGLAP